MKKFVFLLVLILFPFLASAQKDAKAKELLDQSEKEFVKSGGIESGFTLNVKDVINKVTEVFDGRILLRDNKFFVETPDYAIFFDGKTQWIYNKSFDEVNVSEPDEKGVQMLNPTSVYTIYKKGCDYKYLGEKTDIKMRKVHEIELITKGKKEDIKKVILQLDKTTLLPLMFHLFFDNGLENIVYINQYKTGQTLPDAVFSFDKTKYPDVEIIDLR